MRFSGHRKIPPGQVDALARRLRLTIIKLIEDGYIYFLTGGALGFDTLAAKTILALRTNYPHIQLILALPCVSQADKWSSSKKAIYDEIKESADKVIYTSKEHTRECMHKRNRYLVDSSSICVCYLTESTGRRTQCHMQAGRNCSLLTLRKNKKAGFSACKHTICFVKYITSRHTLCNKSHI